MGRAQPPSTVLFWATYRSFLFVAVPEMGLPRKAKKGSSREPRKAKKGSSSEPREESLESNFGSICILFRIFGVPGPGRYKIRNDRLFLVRFLMKKKMRKWHMALCQLFDGPETDPQLSFWRPSRKPSGESWGGSRGYTWEYWGLRPQYWLICPPGIPLYSGLDQSISARINLFQPGSIYLNN